MAPSPGALARDLLELGLELSDPDRVDHLLREVLLGGTGWLDQVSAAEQSRLVSVFDQAYLAPRQAG
jgi:hypothetical protein